MLVHNIKLSLKLNILYSYIKFLIVTVRFEMVVGLQHLNAIIFKWGVISWQCAFSVFLFISEDSRFCQEILQSEVGFMYQSQSFIKLTVS